MPSVHNLDIQGLIAMNDVIHQSGHPSQGCVRDIKSDDDMFQLQVQILDKMNQLGLPSVAGSSGTFGFCGSHLFASDGVVRLGLKLRQGGFVALGELRVISLFQLLLVYAVLVGDPVARIGKLIPVFDRLVQGFKGEGLKGGNCKGFVLVHFFAFGGVVRFGLDLVGVIMNTHLRICKHYLSNSNG